jgi:hypothetical protein
MELTVHNLQGYYFVEGPPGQPFMRRVEDLSTAIEACFENAAKGLLLYSENLTERFFDLSSGEAGEILQKLRNYHIRLAIVRSATLRLNKRFDELMIDESRGSYFRMFDDRAAAQEWLRLS